ncbi:MAG: bifunctional UDP-N-acetylglucosamine diphosphorylase/glucosamine-1-phosphate N-acetyltransferase GlmU [Gammaproteobacteria bacterium]|nr:bifunctional UDP-N-acetylglucosamine diphosphorylase/glucosamine-1-phosphate N-acetyltransferase GlmU [Gammaproteobacteria bacterium]
MKLGVVILAAGQGTRMKSSLPKVLHTLAEKPLLGHVIDTARHTGAERIAVVYGHGGLQVPESFPDSDLVWVEQAQQLGTGHAVEQALPAMQGMDRVLILYGDVPLIGGETLIALQQACSSSALALLTVVLDDPTGYGRIVRDDQRRIQCIVEQKDANVDEQAVREINTGIMLVEGAKLERWIGLLENDNAQREFYLTDIVAMAVSEGIAVQSTQPQDPYEVMGVNDKLQLAQLERHLQQMRCEALLRAGVTMRDPARVDIRGRLTAGRDVELDVNVIIGGDVQIGDGVKVGANTVIRNSRIGSGVQIFENSVIEDAVVAEGCRIGPFARLRPGADLAADVHIGNFVEIKKSQVDVGSKINHLSYIGDCTIGKKVNIGAGTITCNYDGVNKHRTVIEDNVFIGSDTQLVAPVKVGAEATVGAGSTITRDVAPDSLALSRCKQIGRVGWKKPQKR